MLIVPEQQLKRLACQEFMHVNEGTHALSTLFPQVMNINKRDPDARHVTVRYSTSHGFHCCWFLFGPSIS